MKKIVGIITVGTALALTFASCEEPRKNENASTMEDTTSSGYRGGENEEMIETTDTSTTETEIRQ